MTQSSLHNFNQLKEIHQSLETKFSQSQHTIGIQKQIYSEFITIFIKFTKQLAQLSHRINEQILNNHSDETTVNTYQFLSNCLLRMADCSRKVATKGRNEVLDPLEIFGKNYEHICQDMVGKLSGFLAMIAKSEHNLTRFKESYIASAQKLQKYKESQNRIVAKIQKGDIAQLEKFNANMLKLTEGINESQKNYKNGVIRINKEWQEAKMHLKSISISMEYNEESRLSFTRKSVQSSMKLLEEFNNAFDSSCTQKLQQSNNRMLETQQKQKSIDKRLLVRMALLTETTVEQEFISYQEMIRRRKKSMFEDESNHLLQIFTKVTQHDKLLMRQMVKPWFLEQKKEQTDEKNDSISKQALQTSLPKSQKLILAHKSSVDSAKCLTEPIQVINTSKEQQEKDQHYVQQKTIPSTQKFQMQSNPSMTLHSPTMKKANSHEMEVDQCRQKILSFQPYSFYFIEILYQNVVEMTSFYCKVSEEDFVLLLNFLSTITKNLNMSSETSLELLYKMIQISQRVSKKRAANSGGIKGQPIQLLCYPYGKNCQLLKDHKNLKRLLKYIEKRKGLKKKVLQPQKNVMVGLAKGFFSAMTGKKESSLLNLNQDEKFNCLQELTNIMANLSLPNQISLPFVKKEVENNQSSYDYLKGIILAKRDQEQRHRLVYKREVKDKRQQKMRKLLQSKSVAAYCLALTARRGFLSEQDVGLRLVSRSLMKIHLEIIQHLKIPIEKKWPQLIPFNQKLHYIQMKREVDKNGVDASVEEIIMLDVNRSLHLHIENLNPAMLQSLLMTYAYYHKDISYCQGMNYIAGYVYIKTRAQQPAYRIFQYVMELRFKELFLNQFKMLKLKMYQFERLLSIFHPQICEHFKRQGISPECYIISWIITLFASTYQYTMHSYVVDILWQKFIIYGWRQFYKFVLWLFSLHKEDLLEMTYDKVLNRLGEISRSGMFIVSEKTFKEEFKLDVQQQMSNYEVTDQMLQGFLKQYSLS